MGIVVNRQARSIAFPELLVQLDIIAKDQAIRLPPRAERVAVMAGGPVETTRGFVLHSTDCVIEDSTLPISEEIGLTITVDMLRMIARGEGPESAILALGYLLFPLAQFNWTLYAMIFITACGASLIAAMLSAAGRTQTLPLR